MSNGREVSWSPWLFRHATRQRGDVAIRRVPYDDALQVAVLEKDGTLLPAVQLGSPPQTKKADIEKGEDQKDRW